MTRWATNRSVVSGTAGYRTKSIRRRRAGFTVIEMIVAAALLVIGVAATLKAIGMATRTTGIASEYTTASLLAQQRISEIEAQPDQISGGSQTGDFGEEYPQFSWEMATETTDFSNLIKMTITVSWTSAGALGKRSAQFVTYETIPPTNS